MWIGNHYHPGSWLPDQTSTLHMDSEWRCNYTRTEVPETDKHHRTSTKAFYWSENECCSLLLWTWKEYKSSIRRYRYTRDGIYNQRKGGITALANDKNIKASTLTGTATESDPDLAKLQAQVRDMQMEIDILNNDLPWYNTKQIKKITWKYESLGVLA